MMEISGSTDRGFLKEDSASGKLCLHFLFGHPHATQLCYPRSKFGGSDRSKIVGRKMFPRPRSRSPQDPGYAHRLPPFCPIVSPSPHPHSSLPIRFPNTIDHAPSSISPPYESRAQWFGPHPSLSIRMNPGILPPPNSHAHHARPWRRLRSFLRSHGLLRTSVLFSAFILATLVLYTTFSPPSEALWSRPLDWHKQSPTIPRPHPENANPNDPPAVALPPTYPLTAPGAPATSTSVSEAPSLPSQPPLPDVLTLEQIRDIVAPTRGFFSRDYSLGLGWNNVSCPWHRV
jgi:hypothetical protein